MSKQPDCRRLTTWEQRPTPQARTQRRWSTPVQPTASLIQPGYTDRGSRPPRPLRAPVYPLSSRPLLSQQSSIQRTSPNHVPSQQISPRQTPSRQTSPEQISPQRASPQQTSQRRSRLCTRFRRLSRLFRLSQREDAQAQTRPVTSPPPSSIIQPPESSHSAPTTLQHPRPGPISPPAPLSPPEQSLPESPILTRHTHSHTNAHAPANRRPLIVPPPLRDAPSLPTDAARSSLQPGRFALCSACSRVRHCMIGLGAGRVVCTECLREHFIDRQE